MSSDTILPKRILVEISPFYADFDKAEKKTRVSTRTRKTYTVYIVPVHPIGYEETTYRVELFETEYISLKIQRDRGAASFSATLSENTKSGFSDVIFSSVGNV
jgi:hypothetical protein